ncbi:restriction endonuclease subunit S [Clostridium faecium]|nr:restriction endonuclease subunit S [Clostridium faecium]
MILRGDTPKGFIKDDFWIIPSDWEKTKMKDILEERKEYTTDQDTYPLFSLTIEKGVVEKTDRYERQYLVTKDGDNYKVVYENDFVYNPMNIRFGAVALHKLRYPVSVSAYYNTFYIKNGYNPRFIEYFLQSFRMLHFYNNYAEGSLIEKRRLHYSVLLEYSFSFPPIFEQNRIIEILSTWDKAIELKEKLIDEKKKQKAGLMQKLLTGNVRFTGFNDAWEEVKFGKVFKFLNKERVSEPQNYKLLTVKLHLKGIEATEKYPNDTKNGRPYYLREPNEILIGRQNYHNGGIGIVPSNMNNYIASNAISSLTTIKGDLMFLFYYISNVDFYKRVGHMIGGTGQKEISETTMKNLVLRIPKSLEEQKKIGEVLKTADNEIDLLEKELESLKQQKKGLMQLLLTGIIRVNTQENEKR